MSKDMARAAAKVFFGGNAIYGDLKPGDRFTFPTNPTNTIFTKGKNGWYRAYGYLGGRSFKTGASTAVKTYVFA